MPRQKPELYHIQGDSAPITDTFLNALTGGLLLMLRKLSEELP